MPAWVRTGPLSALKNTGIAYESLNDKKKAVEFYRQALSMYLKRSQTTDSEYNRSNVKGLREAISRLEQL